MAEENSKTYSNEDKPEGYAPADKLVKKVEDLGAYVTLLEFGEIEGMVPLSELSRRRIRYLL